MNTCTRVPRLVPPPYLISNLPVDTLSVEIECLV